EVDAGEVFSLFAELLGATRARRIEHALRLDRLAHGPITIHAHDDLGPFIRIVGRAHDALERVAAYTSEQEGFLIFRAGQAHHPFGVAHVRGQVPRLAQFEADRGGLLVGAVRRCRPDEVVADGADLERVLSGAQSIGWKAVAALRIADHADGDG